MHDETLRYPSHKANVKKNLQSELNRLNSQLKQHEELLGLDDSELKALAKNEITSIKDQIKNIEESLAALDGSSYGAEEKTEDGIILNPNIAIVEIRAGTGGDEAGIFGADLSKMYTRYAETKGYKVEELFRSENIMGGIKTLTTKITGKDIYNLLKNESGVHRVQRVPVTESSGRIHTSTATVAVLPEVKSINIEIRPEDLQWDFFRSGGKGGQNVNKVSTAVRLTHVPTGIIVECQEERTQGRNREKALNMLNSRIYAEMKEQQVKSITDLRSSQVGSAERSEKIRTYNFPQDRVTDHRIGKSWGNIVGIMNGEIDKILKTLLELL